MTRRKALEVAVVALRSREASYIDVACEHEEAADILEKMALEAPQAGSSDFCAVPGCACDSRGDCDEPV